MQQTKIVRQEVPPEADEGTSLEHEAVYLIGSMDGYPIGRVVAKYAEVHAAVRERGARVVYDPAIKWLTASTVCYTPTRLDWMRDAIHELTRSDGMEPYYDVAVRVPDEPGVAPSNDVALLMAVASACGIWVVDAENLDHERG